MQRDQGRDRVPNASPYSVLVTRVPARGPWPVTRPQSALARLLALAEEAVRFLAAPLPR